MSNISAKFKKQDKRLEKSLLAKLKKGPKGRLHEEIEAEFYYKQLQPIVIEENEEEITTTTGYNRYCMYCKKGNSKKIVDCRTSSCKWIDERYETKTEIKAEKEQKEE